MADVFISYKRQRRQAAHYLSMILERNGFSTWFDYSLYPGDPFAPQILAELDAAKVVVVLWCARALGSEWVQKEAGLALDAGRYLPVTIEAGLVPPGPFAEVQGVDVSRWNGDPWSGDLLRLLDGVGARVGRPRAPDEPRLRELHGLWDIQFNRRSLADMYVEPDPPRPTPAPRPTAPAAARTAQPAPAARSRPAPPPAPPPARTPPAPARREPAPGEVWTSPGLDAALVWVPPGEFWMGAQKVDPRQPGFDPDAFGESPVRRVRITDGFWLGRDPVTNREYQRFVEATRRTERASLAVRGFDAPDQPVTHVSWDDARAYLAWKTGQLPAGWRAALPTEAQWEWAARGPDSRKYPWGDADPTGRAAFGLRSLPTVGGRPSGAGPFGARDQAGLVWEWCEDGWGPYEPASGTVDNPCRRVDSAASRVFRGGSWNLSARGVRATFRDLRSPGDRLLNLGFRVVFPEHGPRP